MGRTQRNQWLAEFESGAGHLENPLFLADVTMPTAGAVQTGLSTLVQDTGQINSITITTPNYPVVVSAFTFQADQSTLDKIAGGFDVSDTAANLVAALSSLNADPRVDAITADIGSATLSGGVGVNAPSFSESGWGTSLTVSENLNYAGSFSEDAGSTFVLSGGHLLLSGAATFTGGTVDGSNILYTVGTTTVSGLTIGGTVEWVNTKSVTQSGGKVTIGDSSGDKAILNNELLGTYDIADDSGIGRGSSTASDIKNAGLFEKTGGTGVSTIVPNITNNGRIEVTSGTLDINGRILGTGSDTISGASKLQLDAKVSAGQTVHFTGSGGELELHGPAVFAGSISGFDTAGAGSSDTIEVAEPWVFTGFTENAGSAKGTLGFTNNGSTIGLTLIGNYNPRDFVAHTLLNHSTVITYTGVSGLDSLLPSAESGRGDWGAGASWDGSVGHGPGPS